ncbi:MAG: ATP-binding cassette domain-containing protein, partial [Rhodobiaceae bacterium]|nr:ATP-binding cassette domain-containing protein [Rhodobiaceae bacterium]
RIADMAATMRQIDQMMRIPARETVSEAPVRRHFQGRITLDRVSFRYPGTSQAAIAGISLDIKAGEFIAVMGASGAGKTTLLRLMLDLYRPNAGIVCVDGINARQIPNVDLRAAIGYVPQIITLFHGSIAQNLRLAAPEADDHALRRVASELGILEAIEALPQGFDTRIDHESRDKLPTGFRQVLGIAQAFLRDPQILLLDEPAQALDPRIEDHFMAAVRRRTGRVTTVMVTHRPSHARAADRILVLDRGQIRAFDTPDAIFGAPPEQGGAHG